jgi:hypothetical protein
MVERVVCTLWLTMETFVPTSRLMRVDLPAFGAPMSATKPARVAASGVLLRLAPRAPLAAARGQPLHLHVHREYRGMVGAGLLGDRIDRRRQSLRLRPFLQGGLGVGARRAHARQSVAPVALHEGARRVIARIEEDRRDHRLAHVAEHVSRLQGALLCLAATREDRPAQSQ